MVDYMRDKLKRILRISNFKVDIKNTCYKISLNKEKAYMQRKNV